MDRLKAPAKAATLGKFKARLAYLGWLDGLGPTEQWLTGVSAQKIAHFAGQARTTDVGDLRDVSEDKRWTLVASLVHDCRTAARDEGGTLTSPPQRPNRYKRCGRNTAEAGHATPNKSLTRADAAGCQRRRRDSVSAGVGANSTLDSRSSRVVGARSGGVRLRVQFPNRRTVWAM